MELRMAFPGLAQRYPEMRLAVPSEELDYRALSVVYGVESVPVTLG
jgi:cytochrome P450